MSDVINIVISSTPTIVPIELTIGGIKGDKGDQGIQGEQGIRGLTGAAGFGIPTGGNVGQVIVKKSILNYDTEFIDLTATNIDFVPGESGLTSTDLNAVILELLQRIIALET